MNAKKPTSPFKRHPIVLLAIQALISPSAVAFAPQQQHPFIGAAAGQGARTGSRSYYCSTHHHYYCAAASFDFSSVSEWESYYATDQDALEEWHSSVSLDRIATVCLESDPRRHVGDKESALLCRGTKILMVGCGTSRLPEAVWRRDSEANLTLLDSSPTCIEQLQQRYGDYSAATAAAVRYVCGDALQLSGLLNKNEHDDDGTYYYCDAIVDKGLMDALLCGDGWNGPVKQLLQEAADVLRRGGTYVLVSYRLPTSTKEFLSTVGSENGLIWEYDIEGSNNRVGISVALKDYYLYENINSK